MTTAAAGANTFGVIGAVGGLAQSLVAAQGVRWQAKFSARQTMFQNTVNAHNMKIANAQALLGYQVNKASAQAAYMVASAQAQAENKIRAANNERAAAAADLANFAIARNNQRKLESAGYAHEAAIVNRERMREQLTDQSIEGQIAAAEMAGAYAASVAMAGVGGGSVDAITQAAELKNQRRSFYQERNAGYAEYDQMSQIIGIVPQAVAEFDTTVALPNVDTGTTVGPLPTIDAGPPVPGVSFNQQPAFSWGNAGTDILAWFLNPDNKAAAQTLTGAVGSWFNKPSYGFIPSGAAGDPYAT